MRLVIVVADVYTDLSSQLSVCIFYVFNLHSISNEFPAMNFIGISPFFHCDFMCVNSKMMSLSQKNRLCTFVVADPSRYYR